MGRRRPRPHPLRRPGPSGPGPPRGSQSTELLLSVGTEIMESFISTYLLGVLVFKRVLHPEIGPSHKKQDPKIESESVRT